MSVQPMLETKEPVEGVKAKIVPFEHDISVLETKTTSLRRAATALLFFSVLCARPWPSAGWFGIVSSFAILCASPPKLLCRVRFGRFMSFLTIVTATITLVMIAKSLNNGMPHNVGDKIQAECLKMPVETFSWAQNFVTEHSCMRKGINFLSRHMPNEVSFNVNSTASEDLAVIDVLDNKEEWSQPEVCGNIAFFVTKASKAMMIGSALVHLLLLLSAGAVIKRVCRLRCAAYKNGLLEWKKCGGCKYACKQPAAVVAPTAAKELA